MTNNNKEDLLVRLCKRQAVSDFISNENFSEVDYDKILKLEPDEDGDYIGDYSFLGTLCFI
jgi:hypothetical protein